MAVRQYIGARYVTKVYQNSITPGSAEWEAGVTYEPLTLVTYNYSSYLSKKEVPGSVGDPASNPSYWVVTGAYNGQIAQLQNDVQALQFNNFVDVKLYGAVGDGITDDTSAIQDCLDNNSNVIFPAGTYLISTPVDITSDHTIVGYDAIIKHPTAHGFEAGTVDSAPDDSTSNIKIFGLTFDADGSGWSAINFANVANVILDGVTTYGQPPTGSVITSVSFRDACSNIMVNNCDIYGDDYSLIFATNSIHGLPVNAINKDIKISNCKLTTGHGSALALNQGNYRVDVVNCNFDVLGTYSTNGLCVKLLGDSSGSYPDQNSKDVNFSNCTFTREAAANGNTTGISFGHGCDRISISNSSFTDLSTGITPNYLDDECEFSIIGCKFDGCTTGIECATGVGDPTGDIIGNSFKNLDTAINGKFFRSVIDSNSFYKLAEAAVILTKIHSCTVSNNQFENCDKEAVKYTGGSSGVDTRLILNGNMIYNCCLAANNCPAFYTGPLLAIMVNNLINSVTSTGYSPTYGLETTNNTQLVVGNYFRSLQTAATSGTPHIYDNNWEAT